MRIAWTKQLERHRVSQLVMRRVAATKMSHLFVLALLVRLMALWLRDVPPGYSENLKAGFTLATLGFLGNPFVDATGPTAHVAPGFPVMIAAARVVAGSDERALVLVRLMLAAVASFNVALLIPLARSLRLPHASAVIAALFWVVPILTWIELGGEFETVLTTAAAIILIMVISEHVHSGLWTSRSGVAAGVVAGIGALYSPLLLPMVVTMGLFAAGVSRPGWRRLTAYAVGGALGTLAVLAPYTIRNVRVMHGLFAVRDNLGLELSVSNNSRAMPAAYDNLMRGRGMAGHPANSAVATAIIRRDGEVAYNAAQLREALTWIQSNPRAFGQLTAKRLGFFLVPFSQRLHQRLFATTIVMLSIVGAVVLWKSGRRVAVSLIVGAVCGYEAIYLVLQHDIRYIYPMLFVQSAFAGAAILVGLNGPPRPLDS